MLIMTSALALAGDLVVAAGPNARSLVVLVDGVAIPYEPGTDIAQVSGMTGIHRVVIESVAGPTLRSANVSVPQVGATRVRWDGQNLVVGSVSGVSIGLASSAGLAMDPASFASLVRSVESAAFADERVEAVRAAARTNGFTIDQVGQLVDLMKFPDDKVEVVQVCRPKVVDPQNAHALAGHFTFGDDREEALALFR